MFVRSNNPETPLQLRSGKDLQDLAGLVASNFPVSGSSQRLMEPLLAFFQSVHSAPHVDSIAVFERHEVYLSPIMEVWALWNMSIYQPGYAKEMREMWRVFSEVCLQSSEDLTAVVYGSDTRKYPTPKVLASELSVGVKPPATLRLVACGQFQR